MFLGFVGGLWVMPSGKSAFLVEVAHLPRIAVASWKKRTTTPRRHPLVPLVRPRRQTVVLQRISFLSGAVVACHLPGDCRPPAGMGGVREKRRSNRHRSSQWVCGVHMIQTCANGTAPVRQTAIPQTGR